ncbi:MAG: tetratricopeptide repeat protein [Planctomycetes bacterium]|nr:tetratricopeptide repeat protein [Planctomycetota bacterium]
MKRTLLAAVLLALISAVVALALNAAAREREYGRLIADGDRALLSGQTSLAVEAFSGAIALKSRSMLSYLRRGEAYHRRGEDQAALRDLREASRLDPAATRPLELIGDVNVSLDRQARAAEAYEAYLALDDRSPRLLYKLALARHRQGSTAAAVAALRRALALNDRMPETAYLLGVCLREQRQTAEAQKALERAVALAPTLAPAREELASLYLSMRRDRDAIDQLEVLAALEPDRPERQVAVGLAYARAGQPDAAVVTLRRVAERYPEQPAVYVALGRVWLEAAEAGRDRVALGKAVQALEGVARTGSASSEALTLYGRALLLSGDLWGAQRALERAAQALPLDPSSLLHLATTAERLGRYSVGRDALVRYALLTGDDPDAATRAVRIGELSLRLSEPAVAATWFRKAIELTGGSPAVFARLAEVEARLGHADAARAAIEQGLAQSPRHAALLALRRRLR